MTPETPTPRTDAQPWINRYPEYHEGATRWVTADFARQLERENQTFRAAQKACEDCDAPRVDRIAELERELAAKDSHADEIYKASVNLAAKLEADLATERAQLAANHEATRLMGKWLEAERELADRLAALIRRDRNRYEGQVVEPECDCCDCEYLVPIDAALAAWKESRK